MKTNYNLRSSNFAKYCFGKSLANYYPTRNEQFKLDKEGIEEPITNWYQLKAMEIGQKLEKHGIAKWVNLNHKIPNFILGDQVSRQVNNWLNRQDGRNVSLSSTPDGIYKDTILEVKTTKHGKSCFDSFPKHYLPQIYGQQMVMNMWYGQENIDRKITKTHLINISKPKAYTKIWEVSYNQEFINYLIDLLEEYSLKLLDLSDEPLNEKPKFEGNIDDSIRLIWEG